jgi:predicted nucleic acid-binding Zn ribbon protein
MRDRFPADVAPPTARAPLGQPGRECPGCGQPLSGRQQACSGKCRAKLSRDRRRDELRVLALAARQAIETLERRLADPT